MISAIEDVLETADVAGFPADPEFRSAFVAYIEWGTRLAKLNSNADPATVSGDEPMPAWGWGVPGGFLSKGEHPEEGLRREMREEIGVELSDVNLLFTRGLGKLRRTVSTASA